MRKLKQAVVGNSIENLRDIMIVIEAYRYLCRERLGRREKVAEVQREG
jgi:hypothetical protein